MDIPDLPLEVIIHIFKYLPLSDRKQARLVSRHWYGASQDPKLLQQETIVFDRGANSSHMSTFLNSSRPFYHFLFKEGDINWRLTDFWEQFGSNLRSLSILFCDIHEREFVDILSCCPRLQALRTCGCRELLMSGRLLSDKADVEHLKSVLVNLKELCIAHNSYLCDSLLNRFIAISPKLECLSLRGCQISFHQGLYNKFYPVKNHTSRPTNGVIDGENTETMASTSILTFRNILNHIQNNSTRISDLCFSETLLDSPALTQLSQVPNLRLRVLRISGCDQLTNAGIVALTENQKHLDHLDLSSCSRLSDPAIIAVCRNLPTLKHLSVQCCRALTDYSILEIFRLPELISLDVSQCNQVTSEGVIKGICTTSHSDHMQKLSLRGINNMTHDVVVMLAKNLPKLTELDLSYCFTAVTDVSVQAIFKHQIWMRNLSLDGCNNLSDAGFTGMGMANLPESSINAAADAAIAAAEPSREMRISLGSRAEADIVLDAKRKRAVLQMCQESRSFDTPTGYSISRLKGLQTLSLQGCSRISDISLLYAFKFSELNRLDLTQCHQVTHTGLESLSENNRSLEILRLDQCLGITDSAIEILVRNLKRLKSLSLRGCEMLTNESLRHVSAHSESLRRLDMRNCNRLNKDTWTKIPLERVTSLLLPLGFSEASEDLQIPMAPPLPRPFRR